MDPKIVKAVSQHCLNGQLMPSSLEKLWLAKSRGDDFLADKLGLELLTSLDTLNAGYGEEIAGGDKTILANVRAHRRIFKRIGFFAKCEEGELAFDFVSNPIDPPVVRLDTEGEYSWQGINLAEAIFRVGEDMRRIDETNEWLRKLGLPIVTVSDIGASTQFLLSIGDLHDRLYHEEIGAPKVLLPSGTKQAEPDNPVTWMLRPSTEVRTTLARLLGLPDSSYPSQSWVQCDSEGRVCTVWFRPVPETLQVLVNGAMFGMTAAQTTKVLGKPVRAGDGWLSFNIATGRLWVGFEDDKLNEICLMAGQSD